MYPANTQPILFAMAVCLVAFACSTSSGTVAGAGAEETDAGQDVAIQDGTAQDASGQGKTGVDVALSVDAGAAKDDKFSFFVTSIESMQKLSGNQLGFGGNLGGLAGADDICQKTAATVEGGHKTWRAFLSVTKGPDGKPVNAIERIGKGPWYDRNGRLIANNIEDLLKTRPAGDPQSTEDLPNETGQGQKQYGDNHDTLTGSNEKGMLHNTNPASTCQDWTSAVGPGSESKVMGGHSWPRDQKDGDGGTNPGGGTGGKSPPPPAFNACKGKTDGAACSFKAKGGKLSGTCGTISTSSQLVCVPAGGGPGGGGGGGGGGDPASWLMAHTVPGCAPGVQLKQVGGGKDTNTVGGGGGYGGIYCFALTP